MIDDDEALCRTLQLQLEEESHDLRYVLSCRDAKDHLAGLEADLILVDLQLPDGSGLDLLPVLKNTNPSIPLVMITSRQDMAATIAAMRGGAFDYLRKPFDLDEILLLIEKCRIHNEPGLDVSVSQDADRVAPREIIGKDRGILEMIKQIGLLSTSPAPVLILGESGTGKELVAHALHEASSHKKPFVAVNCSAVVPSLFESELFGHEKGAFTGADSRRIGKMEHAETGTLFLDEVGDMPAEQQAKLLRALQEREFERVGGVEKIPLKARVIAATNRDLPEMVRSKVFREDLFYRLAVTTISVPALRERRGDIPLLASHLLRRLAEEMEKRIAGIDEAAMKKLVGHDWPGNIRELENVLTRAIATSPNDTIGRQDIVLQFEHGDRAQSAGEIVTLQEIEKQHVEKALAIMDWNITHTAEKLGIAQNTLRKKISDYGIRPC